MNLTELPVRLEISLNFRNQFECTSFKYEYNGNPQYLIQSGKEEEYKSTMNALKDQVYTMKLKAKKDSCIEFMGLGNCYSTYYYSYIKGYIIIDGYQFIISASSNYWTQFGNSLENSYDSWVKVKGDAYNSTNTVTFKILGDDDLARLSEQSNYNPRYECSDSPHTYKYPTGGNIELIVTEKYPVQRDTDLKLKFSWVTTSKNSFMQNDTIISSGAQLLNQDFKYEVDTNNNDTYFESIKYSVWKNEKVIDCEEKTISILVCGVNCQFCEGTNEDNAKCVTCNTNYSFVEGNNKSCVNTKEFLANNSYQYYLNEDNNTLMKCYKDCATCSGKPIKDSAGNVEKMNCLTCSANTPYFVETGTKKGNCYNSCKNHGLYQKYNKDICVDKCEENYNYTYIKGGVTYCLHNCGEQNLDAQYRVFKTFECVDDCNTTYPYKLYDQPVCVESCSAEDNGYPYILNSNTCTMSCGSNDWLINGTNCTSQCPTDYKYKFFDTDNNLQICLGYCKSDQFELDPDECVTNCTDKGKHFMITKEGRQICSSNCTGGADFYNKANDTCLEDCPDSSFKVVDYKMCVVSCPSDSYEDTINKECISNCSVNDQYLSALGSKCVSSCTGAYPYIYNGQCVSECPSNAGYIGENNNCVAKCEAPLKFIYGNKCVENCYDLGLYQLDTDKCVASCPSTKPYKLDDTIYNDRKCLSECVAPYNFIDGYDCLLECQSPKKGIPSNYLCQDPCTDTQPITYTCSTICPNEVPYKLDGVCSKKCSEDKPLIKDDECVEECSDPLPIKYKDTCVSSCVGLELPLKVNNESCADICPLSYPIKKLNTNGVGDECVDECPSDWFMLDLEKTCSEQCTSTYPFEVVQNSKKYCTNNCKTFGQYLNPDGKCDSFCKDPTVSYIMPPDNICVSDCYDTLPFVNVLNSTCVEKCDDDNYSFRVGNVCHNVCPKNYYEIENTKECVDDCSKVTKSPYQFEQGAVRKCVASCNSTDTFPYISSNKTKCIPLCKNEGAHILEKTNQCIKKCEGTYKYYKRDTDQCLRECPKYIIEGTGGNPDECVDECPLNLPFLYENICVDQCYNRPTKSVIDMENKKCVIGCSSGYDYLVKESNGNKTCYAKCPPQYPYQLGNTNECIDECNDDYPYIQETVDNNPNKRCTLACTSPLPRLYEKGKVCLADCQGLLYFGNNKCVSECEGEYPYLVEQQSLCTNNCKDEGLFISSDKKKCVTNCPETYGIMEENNLCVPVCTQPTPYRDDSTHYCLDGCKDGKYFYNGNGCVESCPLGVYSIIEIKQCVTQCITNYEYKIEDKKYCVSECNYQNYTLIDEANHECLDDCSRKNYYQYNDKCVSSCPDLHKAINNKCQFDLDFEGVSEGKRVSAYTKAQLDEVLSDKENIKDVYNLHSTIQGLDFVLQVYSTDDPFEDMEGVSSLDFSQCEDVLRGNGEIGPNEKIIICKIDTWNNDTISSNMEYEAYKEDGTKLNLLECNIVDSIVSSPFNYHSSIDYELGYNLSLKGIDIFNENDPFYTDICSQFELDNKDVLLSQRKSLYYQNVSFCADGCIYHNISYETKKINCECPFSVGNTNSNQAIGLNDISEDFLNKSDPLNMNTIKCSKLITWENIKENAAFWVGSSMAIGTVSLSIVTFVSSFSSMCSNISVFFASNPTVKEDNYFVNEKATDISSTNRKLSIESIDTVISNGKSSSKELPEFFNEVKPKLNSIYYESNEKDSKDIFVLNCSREEKGSQGEHRLPVFKISHVDYLPFFLALKYDNREYCKMLINIFSQKVMILRSLVKRSPFEMRSLNFSVYMLFLISLFTFNALFYSNGMIQNRFNDEEGNDILLRAFLSSILSVVVYRLFMYLLSFYYLIEALIAESNEKETVMILTKRAINRIKLKVILFYVIHSILICFCWYYLTTFNAVYKCTAMDWLIGGGLSLLLIFIYNSLLVLVITIMRYFGLTVYNKTLYHVAMFMQKYC